MKIKLSPEKITQFIKKDMTQFPNKHNQNPIKSFEKISSLLVKELYRRNTLGIPHKSSDDIEENEAALDLAIQPYRNQLANFDIKEEATQNLILHLLAQNQGAILWKIQQDLFDVLYTSFCLEHSMEFNNIPNIYIESYSKISVEQDNIKLTLPIAFLSPREAGENLTERRHNNDNTANALGNIVVSVSYSQNSVVSDEKSPKRTLSLDSGNNSLPENANNTPSNISSEIAAQNTSLWNFEFAEIEIDLELTENNIEKTFIFLDMFASDLQELSINEEEKELLQLYSSKKELLKLYILIDTAFRDLSHINNEETKSDANEEKITEEQFGRYKKMLLAAAYHSAEITLDLPQIKQQLIELKKREQQIDQLLEQFASSKKGSATIRPLIQKHRDEYKHNLLTAISEALQPIENGQENVRRKNLNKSLDKAHTQFHQQVFKDRNLAHRGLRYVYAVLTALSAVCIVGLPIIYVHNRIYESKWLGGHTKSGYFFQKNQARKELMNDIRKISPPAAPAA